MQAHEERDAEKLYQFDVVNNKLFHSEVACDDYKEKVCQATDKFFSLGDEKAVLEAHCAKLEEKQHLLQIAWDEEVRRAVKAGKQEVAAGYLAQFVLVKEKFEKKNVEADKEIQLQEVKANLDLLDSLMKKEISNLDVEVATLIKQKDTFAAEFVVAQVSDFLVRKLALPQVSKDSVIMKDPETGATRVTDQYASNVGDAELV